MSIQITSSSSWSLHFWGGRHNGKYNAPEGHCWVSCDTKIYCAIYGRMEKQELFSAFYFFFTYLFPREHSERLLKKISNISCCFFLFALIGCTKGQKWWYFQLAHIQASLNLSRSLALLWWTQKSCLYVNTWQHWAPLVIRVLQCTCSFVLCVSAWRAEWYPPSFSV